MGATSCSAASAVSVSPLHVFLESFAEANATSLLRWVGLGAHTRGAAVRMERTVFTETAPVERRADAVVRLDGDKPLVVVIEAQLRVEASKRKAWNSYVAHLYERFECPVVVIVVTTNQAVARWARQPIESSLGASWTPIALGPREMPLDWSEEDVANNLSLAALCAAVHRQKKDAEPLYDLLLGEVHRRAAGGQIDSNEFKHYIDVLEVVSTQRWWTKFLEEDMGNVRYTDTVMQRGLDEGLERGLEKGLEKGRAEAEVSVTRGILKDLARENRLTFDAASLRRLEQSSDADQLKAWLLWVAQQRDATVSLPE